MSNENLHILTDEQLVKMSQEGSETAEELLIEKYKGLVISKASLYYIAGAEHDDVVQEGMIGLFRAIRAYDQSKGASFRTFAELCINAQIINAIKRANRLKNQNLNESVSLNSTDASKDGGENSIENMLSAADDNDPEVRMLFNEIVSHIMTNEAGIFSSLEHAVLSEKIKGRTYLEIAEMLGKTPKSIDNALQRIRRKVLDYLHK